MKEASAKIVGGILGLLLLFGASWLIRGTFLDSSPYDSVGDTVHRVATPLVDSGR